MPNSFGNGADRRPWLIISRREALTLLRNEPGPELERVQHQLRTQLRWIEGKSEEGHPTITRALQRERATA